MNKALDRFLRYARINTTSDENATGSPSTQEQWVLARLLEEELKELGCVEVLLDENCYVYGKIPGNVKDAPVIALIAHMDTADAVPGREFKPRVVRYEGKDITLNEEKNIVLSRKDFPALNEFVGQEIVVTDGTTVLGADDKAGIAEIMAAGEMLINTPDFPHGDVWLVFTPDEEIGSGAELLNLDKIKADFGYTVDGGSIDEIEYENFNAAGAKVIIKGRNVHPGYAKGKMINAIKVGMAFHQLLPQEQTPEETEGYEGFFHLRHMEGTEENSLLEYIIRDHDKGKFEAKKTVMENAAQAINAQYGEGTANVVITDSYQNMRNIIETVPHVINRAEDAIRACGMTPKARPIRGGTDGARLSFRGLPCPNLGTGGMNWHGIYEFLPVNALNDMAKVLMEIVRA